LYLSRLGTAVTVINFDQSAAEEFGKIQSQLKSIGKPTGVLHAVIAAVARSRGDILVTNSTRHFINIPTLR
jgi:tRNA(fMet)-specific endonuclease VapC